MITIQTVKKKKIRGRKLQIIKCSICGKEIMITKKVKDPAPCWDCSILIRK